MPTLTLAGGRFFGEASRRVETTSFVFEELAATVPEREVSRHRHEGPHFVLVTRGAYVTEARNVEGLCPPGTLIFNPGGTTHRDRFRSEGGRFLSITPKADSLDRGSAVPVVLHRPALVRALIDGDADYEALGLELAGATIEPVDCERFIPPWLRRVREMLDDRVSVPIAAIARVAGVHPVSLARAFRRHLGCSPGEYQRRARLVRLRRMLLTRSDAGLAHAALECGFHDQSQMTRAFTRAFGVSPGRFRGFQNDKSF